MKDCHGQARLDFLGYNTQNLDKKNQKTNGFITNLCEPTLLLSSYTESNLAYVYVTFNQN